MLKIAITGGAGSGKSTVARMFAELGAPVIDADRLARDAVAPGSPAWQELRQFLGPEYFAPDGALDRAKVAALVFQDPAARRDLEAIIHPRITAALAARLKELAGEGAPLALVEIPLLYETGRQGAYDRVIVVYVDPEDQVRRLSARDGRAPAEITGIMAAQMPLKDKRALADYVIDNRGDLAATRQQVKNLWAALQKIIDSPPQKG